ncbi:MAG: F0F1 ATP synthase subunit epsilon [Candidatus Omnitrophica bacterium]|nr:F0F1 ATP synthase subunit epsilon [Candidatus Omnitrophota bacterium]MDD5653341.1 F0F1 ATP synthase subunit epsilon [Candidatus Omnitrophota bacterium]
MDKDFFVSIASPEKTIYEGKAVSLIVPAELGYLGVLANHAPFMANTVSGKIIIRQPSGESLTLQAQSKGFLEVLQNRVTLLLSAV